MYPLCPSCNKYTLIGVGKRMWCMNCPWSVDFDPLAPFWDAAEEKRRQAGRALPVYTPPKSG